jgi:hypothetical protein
MLCADNGTITVDPLTTIGSAKAYLSFFSEFSLQAGMDVLWETRLSGDAPD